MTNTESLSTTDLGMPFASPKKEGWALETSSWMLISTTWHFVHNPDLVVAAYQIPNTVSDLWRPNTKIWDTEKITTLFGPRSMETLLQITSIAGDQPDILCWKLTPDGRCTSKSAYKMLATEEATLHHQLIFHLRSYIFLERCGLIKQCNLELRLLLGGCYDSL
jgi:hypothetical protein